MKLNISYGTGNKVTMDFPSGTTYKCVLTNPHVKGVLGYGSNVEARVGGVPQNDNDPIYSDMSIQVTDKACVKA